ncbi:SDR family oxidoreductase [Chroococcidiopsis sp. TS-821]|uniref:SDR family NAD(P)-dependent oxidoreductase n=1 Tax=Chroococcidiopsis sp. TS-821 TaxID=1378066 RepID=UPI000CEEE177|nr:SDR family oxidoreductase [Chroococcidiopsis sp. TS-821]PPS43909.1 ketoacyl reductase [Chroococcidiopsis sp. TS-821]
MTIIAGQTVLLTGASRGIGKSIAHHLAKKKATIIGVARSPNELNKVAADVEALGGKWIGIPFDISQLEELPNLIKKIEQITDSIDILINNAGIEIYRSFADYSLAEIQSILTVNLLAAMELTRAFLPSMLYRRKGHIVNIASLAGKKGAPYNSVYSASKAGLLMWTDALRQELAGTGVEVSAICPGYVSGQGMIADSGVPIPKLAGASTANDVAIALVKAIEQNKAEVVVNQDVVTETFSKIVFAIGQFFPRFGDAFYRLIRVTELNQKRIKNQSSEVGVKS